MSKRYVRADAEVRALVDDVLEAHHEALSKAGVTIDLVMVTNQDETGASLGPALMMGGYPVAAQVKITSLKNRALGLADAEIVIDADVWIDRSEAERRALIDHELTHLTVRTDVDGDALLDARQRPKLRMRLHDHHFGWFDDVARRHGASSYEVQQAKLIVDTTGQLYFPFATTEQASLGKVAVDASEVLEMARAGAGRRRKGHEEQPGA